MTTLAHNRAARRDYEILDTFEAGIVLKGHEVRAVKEGKMSLKGAFVTFRGDEAYLTNAFIAPYQPKNIPDTYRPDRPRKLLLRRSELDTLLGRRQEKGLTIVPLKVYSKGGHIKVAVAVARGKKRHDKREDIKRRDMQRDVRRELSDKNI